MATNNNNASKPVVKKQGAAEVVALRNRFFYVYYRKLSLIFMGAIALCVISLISAFYFAARKTPPVFIAVSPNGQVVPTYPLNQPSNADPEVMNAWVSQWCLEGARRAFSYDYLNYAEQINTAQSYFTYRGWENFVKKLGDTQNFNTVQQQKIIVRFTPKSAPIITASQVREGRLVWAVKFDGTLQFNAHDGKNNGYVQNVVIQMVVVRMSTVDSPKGLGIDQVLVEEVSK